MRDEVIRLIEQGVSLKDISNDLGINYNTVRQISVSNNLLKEFSKYLNKEQIEKMKLLGNNIRALAPIKEDKEYIITIADYIQDGITRKELETIVMDIADVKEKKENIVENIEIQLRIIKERISYLENSLEQLTKKETIDRLTNQFSYIKDIKDKDIRKGYLNLIGLKMHYNNRVIYTLARIVTLNLWNNLRRAEAIDPSNNEILDMEKFIELTINTIKRNNYYKDADKVRDVVEIKHLTIENQLKPLMEEYTNKIAEKKAEIEDLKKDIGKSGQVAIDDYFTERELRNKYVTKQDSITHPKIQQGAAKWLYNNGYISTIELSKDKYKFDVIGYSEDEVIIMEAKASVGDLKGDKKLVDYMDYCDKLYIVSNSYPVCMEALELDNRIGVVMLNSAYNFKEVIREATPIDNGDRSLIMDINKKNSRRFIFGY